MNARTLLASLLLVAAVPAAAQLDFGKLTKGLDKLKEGMDTAKDVSKVAKGVAGIGPQEERNIGDAVALEIIAKYGGLDRDPAITRRVNLVGRALAQYSERPELEWRFGVLASDTVNAFSAPGGYVFITRGLYARATSDDTLAAILAHEIAHITRRHALNIVARQEATAGGKSLLLKRSGSARAVNAQVEQVNSQLGIDLGALVKGLLETGFDAPTEFEADRDGRALAVTNGFAPGGLRAVLVGLKQDGENRRTIFSTHPPLAERIQRLPDEPAPAAAPEPLPEKVVPAGDAGTRAHLNGQVVRLLTPGAEGAWHRHPEGEVLLQAVAADLQVEFREGAVALAAGELLVVPRNREYRLIAAPDARALVVAPAAATFE
jgi:predicted Zn-dependent protease/quercetin dioxygenase-like cupin family protein